WFTSKLSGSLPYTSAAFSLDDRSGSERIRSSPSCIRSFASERPLDVATGQWAVVSRPAVKTIMRTRPLSRLIRMIVNSFAIDISPTQKQTALFFVLCHTRVFLDSFPIQYARGVEEFSQVVSK